MPSRYRKLKINGRTVSEHRHVMEKKLGRPLTRDELVHHKNEDRFDNRDDNLEVMTHQQHSEHHNQKHPKTRLCDICEREYAPHPTKRARSRTCSRGCFRELACVLALERAKLTRSAIARALDT